MPRLMPSSAPLAFLVGLGRGQQQTEAVGGDAQVLAVDADEFRAAQRPGKAEQEQRPIAQPGQVTRAGGDQLAQLGRGQGRGLAFAAAVPAVDAAQGAADRRMPGGPLEVAQAMRMADRRQAALQR
ncbi:hypothetical protein [Siccirubricoccus sp. G192]|uniref:hypothetical protein n=1 Tax=Siccirubricoccus sp. G192 TaxID=2849651 RepID=UPI0020C3A675|nr:hypothetical protein [Siccirubricoccus sp. G192]